MRVGGCVLQIDLRGDVGVVRNVAKAGRIRQGRVEGQTCIERCRARSLGRRCQSRTSVGRTQRLTGRRGVDSNQASDRLHLRSGNTGCESGAECVTSTDVGGGGEEVVLSAGCGRVRGHQNDDPVRGRTAQESVVGRVRAGFIAAGNREEDNLRGRYWRSQSDRQGLGQRGCACGGS